MACSRSATAPKFYRRRDPEASPFYKLVHEYFTEFERVYAERYQKRFGFWRPVIRRAVDKFIECGDLRKGFARVRCPECGEQFFVAYSCKQRGVCPSCDQKRSLILGHRLINEVLASVPHRQWVLTIPKRLRIFFRYDRRLLGKLCRVAYETVRETYQREVDVEDGYVPGMVAAVQSFGQIINWNSHIHAIVSEGVFTESGHFVHVPDIWFCRAWKIWEQKVFDLLLDENKIDMEVPAAMRSWKHSGFSVDNSVRIEPDDRAAMERLIQYISRCPFSLARIVSLSAKGKVVYRAGKGTCRPFPIPGDEEQRPGYPRNFQLYEPLDFLAEVTQHIPDKGEHQIRYYGLCVATHKP